MYREPRLVVLDGDAARRAALAQCLSAPAAGPSQGPLSVELVDTLPALDALPADAPDLLLIVSEDRALEVIAALAASRAADAFACACAGVYLHARAADRLVEAGIDRGALAGELADALPAAFHAA